MAQRGVQRPSTQAATGSGEPAGQSGARQRTAAQAPFQASASSLARFAVSTRAQTSAAQQPALSLTGSAAYVVVAQSASLAQSAPAGGAGRSPGVGPGPALSFGDEQAIARTSSRPRMERLCL
jgi:hypothetical protein